MDKKIIRSKRDINTTIPQCAQYLHRFALKLCLSQKKKKKSRIILSPNNENVTTKGWWTHYTRVTATIDIPPSNTNSIDREE